MVTPDSPADETHRDLARKTAGGVRWNLVGTIGTNALRVIVIPILGRLLTPNEFGVVAAALTVIAFATFLKDAGVGNALVQRKELSERHVEAAFAFSIIFGVVLAGGLAFVAPAIAELYGVGELTPMVRALALMFVFRGLATVPMAMARRSMRFRDLALIDLGSYLIGNVITVVLALAGYGAWSIVIGYVVESALGSVCLLARRPVRYRPLPDIRYLRDLAGYGIGHVLGEIANYFAYQGDNIVVGHQLGPRALGLYTRAYDLMRYPAVAFSNIAGSVLFAAFSRIQDERQRLARVYRQALFAVSAVLLPTSAALFVLAPELIQLLLGERWDDAILPFQILAASMLPRTTFKLGVTIARAAGDVFWVALANLAYGAMVIGGAMLTVRWGIVGVSTSTAIAVWINFLVLSYLGLRRTELTWLGFAGAHVQALATAAVTLALLWPTAAVLRASAAPPVFVVVGASAAGLAGAIGWMLYGVRRHHADWTWFYGQLRTRVRRRKSRTHGHDRPNTSP